MGVKDDLKAAKELMNVKRQEIAEMERLKATQMELLKSTKLTKAEWNKIQGEVQKFDAGIGKATTSLNQMASDVTKVEDGLGKAEARLDAFSSKAQGLASKIPIVGDSFAKGIGAGTDKAKKIMDKWVKKTDGGLKKSFKILGGILGGLLLGGVIAMFAMFMKLLGKAKENAYEYSAAMTEASRAIQLSVADTKALAKGGVDMVMYGQGWASSIAAIRDDMGIIPNLTAKENKLIGKLATNAGLGADQIANMYRHSQSMGLSLDSYVKNQEKKIKQLNLENGTYFSQAEIVKDIAGASDSTLAMFGKQNQELEKQVLIGKKIGLNLNQQASIAKSLLDIESSIESEMEARVLTGKELNFDKARELALNGDISGASAEIMDQVGGISEFNKMNIIQKEALAKAAGMEVGQLQKSLEMQAAGADQAKLGGTTDPGGGGLDAATKNVDKQTGEDARSRRWGELLGPSFKALEDIRKGIEDKLYKWFTDGGGGEGIIKGINDGMTALADWILEGKEPEWYTNLKNDYLTPIKEFMEPVFKWIGENPIKSAIAGTALGLGAKKLYNYLGFGKMGTSGNPMYVTIGAGGVMNTISDFLRGGKKGGWRRNLLASWKKTKKSFLSKTGITGAKQNIKKKAKGSWLGRMWGKAKSAVKGVATKVKSGVKGAAGWAGGKLNQGWQTVKRTGSKIISAVNPIPKLKKSFTGGAGKWIKKALKGVGSVGKKAIKGGLIGALFNAAALAPLLMSDATPMEKAKGIVQQGSGILGGALGSIAGSFVPGIGTLIGGIAGGLLGDWIGSMAPVQNALAPPIAKIFKGEEVQDFILSDKGLIKFQKDDLVIGGTKLNEGLGTGDNKAMDEMVRLMTELIRVTREDRVMSVDGKELAKALAETQNYKGVS